MGRAGVPSDMKAEHLKAWIMEATRKKNPDTEHWDKLVSVTELVFRDVHILEALEWTTMVLITKSGGGYRGI